VYRARLLIILASLFQLPFMCAAVSLVWPTANPAFSQGEGMESFVQPTVSGEVLSGTFGAVRNNGTRFHEGLDLKPFLKRTRKGEATDPIYAAMDGVVAHVAKIAGRSSYGRYVVLIHDVDSVQVYTLYAHLSSIDEGLTQGMKIKAGTVIGVMGRSAAGYSISKDRAHLHFEIGLLMGDNFQAWYAKQKFSSPNYHGNYNGMNLTGFDPLAFYEAYRDGKVQSMATYIRSLPTAYVLRVTTANVPAFVLRNPALVKGAIPADGLVGWDIAFTWYGMPKEWTPLQKENLSTADKAGGARLVAINRDLVGANHSRNTVRIKNGNPVIYKDSMDSLEKLFGKPIVGAVH